jgi:hypothetical protein
MSDTGHSTRLPSHIQRPSNAGSKNELLPENCKGCVETNCKECLATGRPSFGLAWGFSFGLRGRRWTVLGEIIWKTLTDFKPQNCIITYVITTTFQGLYPLPDALRRRSLTASHSGKSGGLSTAIQSKPRTSIKCNTSYNLAA